MHDDWNLGLVYEVLRFDPASSPAQRERRVTEAKAKYAALLRRFAQGNTDNLTAHEQRICTPSAIRPRPPTFAMPSTEFASSWARPTASTRV
jgi:hypothetical protein